MPRLPLLCPESGVGLAVSGGREQANPEWGVETYPGERGRLVLEKGPGLDDGLARFRNRADGLAVGPFHRRERWARNPPAT